MQPSTIQRFIVSSLLIIVLATIQYQRMYAQETDITAVQVQIFLPLISNEPDPADASDERGQLIPHQYIVGFHNEVVSAASVTALATDLSMAYGGEIISIYDTIIGGFAVQFPAATSETTVAQLRQDPRVAYVEQSQYVTLPSFAPIRSSQENNVDGAMLQQDHAPWGLDRIDQRTRQLDGRYNYNRTGTGVDVYIIDSGIDAHNDLTGRVRELADFFDGTLPADDCSGHGTAVASIAGGTIYGVAKNIQLVDVRVFDCINSSVSDIKIANALKTVFDDRRNYPTRRAVVNLSLQALGKSNTIDRAVVDLINANIVVVAGAGNGELLSTGKVAYDACRFSPTKVGSVITVAATNNQDQRATFAYGYSNFGKCVDLFAPGHNIDAAMYNTSSEGTTVEGTSFAAPYASGAVALYLQANPTATPAQVATALGNAATANVVSDPGKGSPNRLLYIEGSAPATSAQKLAIPAYFFPGESPGANYWAQLVQGAPTVGIAIVNPDSGVGAQIEPNYQTQVNTLRSNSIKPIGYVNTDEGRRVATAVKAEIDLYRTWYGVTDIMLDSTPTDCSKVAYYQDLYSYIRARTANAAVIISPGTNFSECMMQIGSDVIAVAFEDTYAKYKKWQPDSWMANYPANRFWHQIWGASANNLAAAVARSKQLRADWVYITPDKDRDPWNTLPPLTYWALELELVRGTMVSAADLLAPVETTTEMVVDEAGE